MTHCVRLLQRGLQESGAHQWAVQKVMRVVEACVAAASVVMAVAVMVVVAAAAADADVADDAAVAAERQVHQQQHEKT